ncbi:MAG TPA: polysaccharide deacetylase [Verrucomicrobiales bacterium]|nr:polysaccharide deacetylase [Verrucomicrobiales bacterium]
MNESSPRPPANYFSSLRGWETFFAAGTPVLTYHKIGPRPRGARLKGMYLPAALLKRQLGEFKISGYHCPSYDAVVNGASAEGKRCFITFDDGCVNVLDHALPLLRESGAAAIQFLVAGLLGRRTEWQAGTGEILEPIMDASQVREWLAAGQSIGAHTMTHPRLTTIAVDRAKEEIFASRKSLEDTFGIPIRHFCYPYGDLNERVVELVREAGYETAATTDLGVNTAATDPHRLKRITARYPSRKFKNLPLLARLAWHRLVGG